MDGVQDDGVERSRIYLLSQARNFAQKPLLEKTGTSQKSSSTKKIKKEAQWDGKEGQTCNIINYEYTQMGAPQTGQ